MHSMPKTPISTWIIAVVPAFYMYALNIKPIHRPTHSSSFSSPSLHTTVAVPVYGNHMQMQSVLCINLICTMLYPIYLLADTHYSAVPTILE